RRGVPGDQGRRVHAPFAQGGQRPGGGGPRLAGQLAALRIVEEAGREEGAAGPEPGGGVLAVQQRGPVPLLRDPGPGGLPLLLRGVEQVALDLPAQRRIGVQEPVDHVGGSHRLLRCHRGKGPNRDQAKNTDRTASTIDGSVAGTPSPRRVCTSAAKTIVIARPAPASGTSTVATPVSAGRSSPIAPRISSTPIPRITDCGKSST